MRSILVAYRQAYSGLPRETWLVALVALVNRSGTMVLPFLTLYLTERRGYEADAAGLFVMVYGCGAFLGTIWGGRMTDIIGPLPVQLSSLLAAAVTFFVLSFSAGTWLIGAVLFLLGVVGEAFRPASATLVARTCPPELRTRAYALQRLAVNLGMAIGPAIGGWLATVGYVWLFWVDGVTCFSAAALLYFLFGKRPLRPLEKTTEEASTASPWRDGVMVVTLLVSLALACVFFQLFSTMPLYLKDGYGMSKAAIGSLLALNPIIIVAFEMLLVRKLQHVNPFKPMAIGALLIGLGFGLMPWGHTVMFAVFTLLIWTLGEMLESPQLFGFIANRANDSNRGRYMGAIGLVFSLAIIVAPALGTAVYKSLGPIWLWTGTAVVGAAVSVVYWCLAMYLDRSRSSASTNTQEVETTAASLDMQRTEQASG